MTRLALALSILVCAVQGALIWRMAERSAELERVAGEAAADSDDTLRLALEWQGIAEKWRGLFGEASGRCVAGRAL